MKTVQMTKINLRISNFTSELVSCKCYRGEQYVLFSAYRSRAVVALLVTVCHSELVEVVFHARDVVGATTQGNVYLVQLIKLTSVLANPGFITIALVLDEIRHVLAA